MGKKIKLVIAISGASGSIYPKQLLTFLKQQKDIELFVVASKNAHQVFAHETGSALHDFHQPIYQPDNFNVPYVSGSAKLDAMVIVPCSMGTLARIACGISNDSISRAADVFLKEKRQLIVVPRETPYNTIQLQNMLTLAQAGATILPATPSFYSAQKTMEDVAHTVTARILDHLNIEHDLLPRWHQNS